MATKLARKEAMSSRERITSALRGLPVDRIPFAPLVSIYTLMEMPAKYKLPLLVGGRKKPWKGLIAALKNFDFDIMVRHVPVNKAYLEAPHLGSFGKFNDPVKVSSNLEDGVLVETLDTPVGTLTAQWEFTDKVGVIPHATKHLVNDYEELKIFQFALEHLALDLPEADYSTFQAADAEIGERGIVTATLPNTPLIHLIEMLWGLPNTHYMLHDYREEVEAILDRLHEAQTKLVERLADSPAQVIIQYENTSSTLISPAQFRQYCLPYLNRNAEVLRQAGKIFLVHMCGRINAFVSDFPDAGFTGITDIAPPPTGDILFQDVVSKLPGKVVIGGVDATTFINPDPEEVRVKMVPVIENIQGAPGVMLGSGDVTPRGTQIHNFELIMDLVRTI